MVHVGLIPDGNRRWCARNGKSVQDLINGHVALLTKLLSGNIWDSVLSEITEFSVFLLTKDNLQKRDSNDDTIELVYVLISHMRSMLLLHPDGAARMTVRFVGELEMLPERVRQDLDAIQKLAPDGGMRVTIGIAYDPVADCQRFFTNARREQGKIDLVFRPGGEVRSSGFFPMHTMYAEFVYVDTLFPDIRLEDIRDAIQVFHKRNRRFGA
jgi:undecaprenyl diphosphate synthase